MLTYTPRRRTVHAIPLLLNAFYIKMAGKQTEEKKKVMSSGPVIQLDKKGNGPLLVMPPFLADSDEEESRQTLVS